MDREPGIPVENNHVPEPAGVVEYVTEYVTLQYNTVFLYCTSVDPLHSTELPSSSYPRYLGTFDLYPRLGCPVYSYIVGSTSKGRGLSHITEDGPNTVPYCHPSHKGW